MSTVEMEKLPEWQLKKLRVAQKEESDIQKFVMYSFKKNFKMNQMNIELYKPPKILGDVFEAIVGAIFKDGGIERLLEVLKPFMAPCVLYVAKFSKKIHKEPKEDFIQLASQLKMKPKFNNIDVNIRLSDIIPVENKEEDHEEQKMTKTQIIYNNGQIMVVGYGSTKDQAERNASIMGLNWLV